MWQPFWILVVFVSLASGNMLKPRRGADYSVQEASPDFSASSAGGAEFSSSGGSGHSGNTGSQEHGGGQGWAGGDPEKTYHSNSGWSAANNDGASGGWSGGGGGLALSSGWTQGGGGSGLSLSGAWSSGGWVPGRNSMSSDWYGPGAGWSGSGAPPGPPDHTGTSMSNGYNVVSGEEFPDPPPSVFEYKPHFGGKDINNLPHILPPGGKTIEQLQASADLEIKRLILEAKMNQHSTAEKIQKLKKNYGYGTFGYEGFKNPFRYPKRFDLGTHKALDLGTSIDYNALKGRDGKLKLPVQTVYKTKTLGIHIPEPYPVKHEVPVPAPFPVPVPVHKVPEGENVVHVSEFEEAFPLAFPEEGRPKMEDSIKHYGNPSSDTYQASRYHPQGHSGSGSFQSSGLVPPPMHHQPTSFGPPSSHTSPHHGSPGFGSQSSPQLSHTSARYGPPPSSHSSQGFEPPSGHGSSERLGSSSSNHPPSNYGPPSHRHH